MNSSALLVLIDGWYREEANCRAKISKMDSRRPGARAARPGPDAFGPAGCVAFGQAPRRSAYLRRRPPVPRRRRRRCPDAAAAAAAAAAADDGDAPPDAVFEALFQGATV